MALGDDRGFSLAFFLCDWLDLSALETALKAGVASQAAPEEREAAIGTILEHHSAIAGIVDIHCEQSRTFAARLPLPSNVVPCMPYLYARWDGGLSGVGPEDIPAPVRAVSIGQWDDSICISGSNRIVAFAGIVSPVGCDAPEFLISWDLIEQIR